MFYTSNLNKMIDDFFNAEAGVSRVPIYSDGAIHIPLPGYRKEDIEIDIEGRNLVISAEIDPSNETYFRRSFAKSYMIGSHLNPDLISASMQDGVLTLNLEQAHISKRIAIK